MSPCPDCMLPMLGRTVSPDALGPTQPLAWASGYLLPSILAEPIAADLVLSVSTVFAAFSGALLLSACLGPMVGRVIDRNGGRGVLTLSNLIFAAGLVLLALADGLTGLLIAWAVPGVGMSPGLYDSALPAPPRPSGPDAPRPHQRVPPTP